MLALVFGKRGLLVVFGQLSAKLGELCVKAVGENRVCKFASFTPSSVMTRFIGA